MDFFTNTSLFNSPSYLNFPGYNRILAPWKQEYTLPCPAIWFSPPQFTILSNLQSSLVYNSSLIYLSQKEGRTWNLGDAETEFVTKISLAEFPVTNIKADSELYVSAIAYFSVLGCLKIFLIREWFVIRFLPTFLFHLWWRRRARQITLTLLVKRSLQRCTRICIWSHPVFLFVTK